MALRNFSNAPVTVRKDKLLIVVCPMEGEIDWSADNLRGCPKQIVERLAQTITHVLTERRDFEVCVVINYSDQGRYIPTIVQSLDELNEALETQGFKPPRFLHGLYDVLKHVTFFADMPNGDAFENPLFAAYVFMMSPVEIYVGGFESTLCVYDTATGKTAGKYQFNFRYIHDISGPPDRHHSRAIQKFTRAKVPAVNLLCFSR